MVSPLDFSMWEHRYHGLRASEELKRVLCQDIRVFHMGLHVGELLGARVSIQ